MRGTLPELRSLAAQLERQLTHGLTNSQQHSPPCLVPIPACVYCPTDCVLAVKGTASGTSFYTPGESACACKSRSHRAGGRRGGVLRVRLHALSVLHGRTRSRRTAGALQSSSPRSGAWDRLPLLSFHRRGFGFSGNAHHADVYELPRTRVERLADARTGAAELAHGKAASLAARSRHAGLRLLRPFDPRIQGHRLRNVSRTGRSNAAGTQRGNALHAVVPRLPSRPGCVPATAGGSLRNGLGGNGGGQGTRGCGFAEVEQCQNRVFDELLNVSSVTLCPSAMVSSRGEGLACSQRTPHFVRAGEVFRLPRCNGRTYVNNE